ncbi:MAG: protein translocase subunit SecF [Alphaproteobacteria bacterium]|nr:protein translocase subunit SecF [Alphaproteobacteria bacterium]
MRGFSLFPAVSKFNFVGVRLYAFLLTGTLFALTAVSLSLQGLALGIDFRGGILLEVAGKQAFDLGDLRAKLGGLGVGEVELQDLGTLDRLLIRVEKQDGGDEAQLAASNKVKELLGPGVEYRRVETVGPKVSTELFNQGLLAAAVAVLAIAGYVAFRFEWQFGIAAMVATLHDVVTTVGLFSLFGIEFNLTSIAAILTIAGYSVNDTVVVFDRIRENLRKFKTMGLAELINLSVNETIARTVVTSSTTMLATLALLFFGGPVLAGFSLAMAWGIIIGTYSTVYVASSLMLYLPSVRQSVAPGGPRAEQATTRS